jgi:hypothetical protein
VFLFIWVGSHTEVGMVNVALGESDCCTMGDPCL